MRAGLVGDVSDVKTEETLETIAALLRVFTTDSIEISCKYARAKGRSTVTGNDMRNSLKYVARTFFQTEGLEKKVEQAKQTMRDEDEQDEQDEEEEDGEEKREENDAEGDEECSRVARNVDTVVKVWDLWRPEDPVEQLIKRSIDGTEPPHGNERECRHLDVSLS